MLTTHSLTTTAPHCSVPPASPVAATLYEIRPFRHTLKQFLQESPSERNIQQACKWSLINYAWLQHMNHLLPPASSSSDVKHFWLDRHITIPGSFSPPPPSTTLTNYYNTCYTQLQHQIIYAAAQPFASPFTQALLKHNIGNPHMKSIINTYDDEDDVVTLADDALDESFWPSVQEQFQKMMLHQNSQQYNINYELPLIELHDAYAEKQEYSPIAPNVSVLEPYVPCNLSLIDVYEFSDTICFFKRDEPLAEDEFHDQFKWFTHLQDRAKLNNTNKEDFRDFCTWLRLINKSFVQITHTFPSQKHYINKQFISPHFQHYNFLFYGFSKHLDLLTKLATYLKLLPLKDEPSCRMSYSVQFYRPYTSWQCIPAKQEGCGCCTDYNHKYVIDDEDADHFLSECLELVLPFRTLHEKQQK
eukprot:gene4374-4958_t